MCESHPVALTMLSEEEKAFAEAVRDFAKEQIGPRVEEMDKKAQFDKDLIQKMFEMGLMGIEIPERWGGAGCSFFMAILAVEELAKQAQTALTVTWTLIGTATLVIGLARHRPMLRHAGFGLLGLAIAKVVLIDMASMDVAYRAVVLAGVGLLLLASAYLWTHFRGPRSGVTGITGGPHPAA